MENQTGDDTTTMENQSENDSTTQMMQMMVNLIATLEKNRVLGEQRMIDMINRQNQQNTEVRPKYHIMPDLSKSITTFHGLTEEDANDWMQQINSTAKLHNWPEEFKLETARSNLRGPALQWYKARSENLNSWTSFEFRFKKTFVVTTSLTERWEKMRLRIQRSNESVSEYFHEKYKLCQNLKLSFEEMKEQIIVGLCRKDVITSLLAKFHEDEDELLHDLMLFERIHQNSENKTTHQRNYMNTWNDKYATTSRSSDEELKCYLCEEFGHMKTDCKKGLVCRRCKNTGHISRDCRNTGQYDRENFRRVHCDQEYTNKEYYNREYSKARQFERDNVEIGHFHTNRESTRTEEKGEVNREKQVLTIESDNLEKFLRNVKVGSICTITEKAATRVDIIIGRTFTERPELAYARVGDVLKFGYAHEEPFSCMEWKCKPNKIVRNDVKPKISLKEKIENWETNQEVLFDEKPNLPCMKRKIEVDKSNQKVQTDGKSKVMKLYRNNEKPEVIKKDVHTDISEANEEGVQGEMINEWKNFGNIVEKNYANPLLMQMKNYRYRKK